MIQVLLLPFPPHYIGDSNYEQLISIRDMEVCWKNRGKWRKMAKSESKISKVGEGSGKEKAGQKFEVNIKGKDH